MDELELTTDDFLDIADALMEAIDSKLEIICEKLGLPVTEQSFSELSDELIRAQLGDEEFQKLVRYNELGSRLATLFTEEKAVQGISHMQM